MTIKFNELIDGAKFKINNIEYQKIPLVKISCCKSMNAVAIDNDKNRIHVAPLTEVEIDDQLQ